MIWNAARERKERKPGVSYSEHITVPIKKRYQEISAYLRYVRISFRPAIRPALLQRYVTSVPGRSPHPCGCCGTSAAIARLLRHIPACRDQPCPTASTGNPASQLPPRARSFSSHQKGGKHPQLSSLSMSHAGSKVLDIPMNCFWDRVRTDKGH